MILFETVIYLFIIFRCLFDRFAMAASSSNNPLVSMLDANKLRGADNYADWDLDLRIVLNSEKLGYVLEGPLPTAVPEDGTPEEFEVLQK